MKEKYGKNAFDEKCSFSFNMKLVIKGTWLFWNHVSLNCNLIYFKKVAADVSLFRKKEKRQENRFPHIDSVKKDKTWELNATTDSMGETNILNFIYLKVS